MAARGTAPARQPLGVVFCCLLAVHILVKLAIGALVLDFKPTGDENAYIDAAMALSNLGRDAIHLAAPDIDELRKNIIGNGWFMPGMPALMAPLYAIDPDAGTTAMRIYLGCLSFGLWLWAVLAVRRHIGRAYAYALMLFPSLVPVWVAFSFTAWGDLYAGLLVVILFSHAFTAIRRISSEGLFPAREGACIGALAIVGLYLRSSISPLVLALFAALWFASLVTAHRGMRRLLPGNVAALALFLAILLPWSLCASHALGARVATTTTVPLSMAATFGDKDEICFGRCKRGNIWFNAAAYSKAVALDAGVSELTIQKEMSRNAMRDVTAARYVSGVLANFGRYAFNPGSFAGVFADAAARHDAPGSRDRIAAWLRTGTMVPYFAFLVLLVAAWFTVAKRRLDDQVASLLVKTFSVALLAQPFVHVGGGRYWPTFGPMFALAGGLLWSMLREHRQAGIDPGMEPNRWFTWLQWAFIAGLVAAAGVLLVLGAQGGYFRP